MSKRFILWGAAIILTLAVLAQPAWNAFQNQEKKPIIVLQKSDIVVESVTVSSSPWNEPNKIKLKIK